MQTLDVACCCLCVHMCRRYSPAMQVLEAQTYQVSAKPSVSQLSVLTYGVPLPEQLLTMHACQHQGFNAMFPSWRRYGMLCCCKTCMPRPCV